MTSRSSISSDAWFAAGCAFLFAVVAAALPAVFPLLEPDSRSYLGFSASRTALYPLFLRSWLQLGLQPQNIIYVQLALFSICFAFLVASLRRWSIRRRWLVLLTIAIGANPYFSGFQRTILAESLTFSVLVLCSAFLLDYLRTGRALFLTAVGLLLGVSVGIRPACVTLIPMIPIAALLKRRQRDVSTLLLVVAAVLPIVLGWVPERLLYRLEHGNRSESVTPHLLSGKAAMLVRPDMTFTGPHAPALQELAGKLNETYGPVRTFLSNLPSLVAWPVLTAFYEAAAQFQIIGSDLDRLAKQYSTTGNVLRMELGKQVIAQAPLDYLRLSLVHYFGQWSITALNFPPAALAVNAYRASVASVPLYDVITPMPFAEPPSLRGALVYPAFLLAGIVTLVLAFLLPALLLRPPGYDEGRKQDLMMAAFFGLLCHSSMLLTSFVNVSTPRFLMMVYPHILLAGLFLVRAVWPDLIGRPT